jgi:hypothetical protein
MSLRDLWANSFSLPPATQTCYRRLGQIPQQVHKRQNILRHREGGLKIRLVVTFVGLAISFCLPTFAQQTNTFQRVSFTNALTTGDQDFRRVGAAGNELSVIGRWGQTFKGQDFAPIQINGYVWKKRMLTGLDWLRSRPVWSLPRKIFYATFKAPMTSLFAKK